eukprot:6768366-Prymnesium_polylepis.1
MRATVDMLSPELHLDAVVESTNCTQTREALLSARRNALVASHRHPLAFKAAMESKFPRSTTARTRSRTCTKLRRGRGSARGVHTCPGDSKEEAEPSSTARRCFDELCAFAPICLVSVELLD